MNWSSLILRQKAQDSIADLPALKILAERIAASILHGAHGQKKAGGSERFWQFREYAQSDRPQDIDWRQSAKTENVFVREKELQTPQSVYFWNNRSKSMDFKSDDALYSKSECAQIISVALAMLFRNGDERVGVLGQGRAGHSENAIDGIGRYVMGHGDAGSNNTAPLPAGKVPSKSGVVLCGDFLEPYESIKQSFENLTSNHSRGVIVQILDHAEIELPYRGNRVFDDGVDVQQKVDHVSSIRDAYKTRLRAHNDALVALCGSHGWLYHLHVTNTPIEESVREIWEGHKR